MSFYFGKRLTNGEITISTKFVGKILCSIMLISWAFVILYGLFIESNKHQRRPTIEACPADFSKDLRLATFSSLITTDTSITKWIWRMAISMTSGLRLFYVPVVFFTTHKSALQAYLTSIMSVFENIGIMGLTFMLDAKPYTLYQKVNRGRGYQSLNKSEKQLYFPDQFDISGDFHYMWFSWWAIGSLVVFTIFAHNNKRIGTLTLAYFFVGVTTVTCFFVRIKNCIGYIWTIYAMSEYCMVLLAICINSVILVDIYGQHRLVLTSIEGHVGE